MTDMTQRLAALPAERRAQFFAQLRAQAEGAAKQGPTPRRDTGPALHDAHSAEPELRQCATNQLEGSFV